MVVQRERRKEAERERVSTVVVDVLLYARHGFLFKCASCCVHQDRYLELYSREGAAARGYGRFVSDRVARSVSWLYVFKLFCVLRQRTDERDPIAVRTKNGKVYHIDAECENLHNARMENAERIRVVELLERHGVPICRKCSIPLE